MNQEQLSEMSELLNQPEPQTVDETVDDTVDNMVDNMVDDTIEDTVEDDTLPAEEEESYDFPQDLNSLAEEINMEISDLYNVKINMPDGEDSVTISDIKNKYTETLRTNTKLQEQIKQQAEIAQSNQGVSANKTQLLGQLSELERQYRTVDWQTLEKEDPGQAALHKQKFQEAAQLTQQSLQEISLIEQHQSQSELTARAQHTLTLIPEWKDSTIRTNETNEITNSLLEEGLSQQQISNISDPLTIKLYRELITLRKNQINAKETLKQVNKKPTPLRRKRSTTTNNNNTTNNLIDKARTSKTKQDQLDAAKSILGL